MSKSELYSQVEEYRDSDVESFDFGQGWRWVGLYRITSVYRRENCIILQTHTGLDYYAGFAYCEGAEFSERLSSQLKHLEGNWWEFDVYH